MKIIKKFFTPVSAAEVVTTQLYEAERLALEHEASAEHHDALAIMYRSRVERLRAEVAKSAS